MYVVEEPVRRSHRDARILMVYEFPQAIDRSGCVRVELSDPLALLIGATLSHRGFDVPVT
jgi:hypothetical protein